jgi:hypothetical protein
MKDTFVRARISREAVGRWKATARERGRSLSALLCGAVEAAIVGTVDQDSLDKHLRDIRADANAAHEATTLDEARSHIRKIHQRIAALRGVDR